jgi:hypothetical protein
MSMVGFTLGSHFCRDGTRKRELQVQDSLRQGAYVMQLAHLLNRRPGHCIQLCAAQVDPTCFDLFATWQMQ